jgi:hypothetical protein
MPSIVDPTVPVVKNLLLLDSEGKRIAVKYYSDDWCAAASANFQGEDLYAGTCKRKGCFCCMGTFLLRTLLLLQAHRQCTGQLREGSLCKD